ncbi:MAG: PQQ-binding-like beta-propeller repeat protein [Acidobacteria bacterium]|nr:PQQ-binding-like beta-propeller repeat protein [Acidobacteriota bacterium]
MSAPAAFDAERAYVPLRNGLIVAVGQSDGRTRWSVDLPTTVTPAAAGGLVFVGSRSAVYALAAANGTVRWTAPVNAPIAAPVLFHTDWLILGLESREIVALRGSSGDEVWRRTVGAAVTAQPAISGDRVFSALADGRVVAFDLRTGDPVWERRLGAAPTELLALEDRLFVGSKDNFFYRLDLEHGDVEWRWRTGADIIGRAAADDRNVYFASLDNVLRALDRGNGAQRWKAALPVRPISGPVWSDGALFVAGAPSLHAFSAGTGAAEGQFGADAELLGPPHVFRTTEGEVRLVAVTGDGSVFELRHRVDPPLRPLDFVPGTKLAPEPAPRVLSTGATPARPLSPRQH